MDIPVPLGEKSTLLLTGSVALYDEIEPQRAWNAARPREVVDLLLCSLLRRKATFATLQPDGPSHVLCVKRGSMTLANIEIPVDVGNAAVVRLAHMADLDPLVERGTPAARGNVTRLCVRVGSDRLEVIASVAATRSGMEAELRTLLINGHAVETAGRGPLKRCPSCERYYASHKESCDIDQAELVGVTDDLEPGGTIGAYRIFARIGVGGLGEVFSGEHALIQRPVAIKLLHPWFARNPSVAGQFLSEARAASRLRHPSIVDVTDFGTAANGSPYMVMEMIQGQTLASYLLRTGALPLKQALLIIREVAIAIETAHRAGVLHNDLKPPNVMILPESTPEVPRLKVVDFGAASILGPTALGQGPSVGTPLYMAPELLRGESADVCSDIYALGVVLFQMLSGQLPYEGTTVSEVTLAQERNGPPLAESPHGPLPEPVNRLLDRCLAIRSRERYPSVGGFLADLDHAIDVLGRDDWRRWLP